MNKKIIVCVCMAYAGMTTALVASYDRGCLHADDNFTVINLTNMTNEQLEAFFLGQTIHIVLECPEGTSLPLRLAINGDYLALDPLDAAPYKLKIMKTCFIKHDKHDFLFSDDCIEWKRFSDFFSGKIGVAYDPAIQEAELTLELNSKN